MAPHSSLELSRERTSISQESKTYISTPIDVYEQDTADGSAWTSHGAIIDELAPSKSHLCVIFLSLRLFLNSPSRRRSFSERFGVPPCFWADAALEAAGNFGSLDETNDAGDLQAYSSWFQFLAKQPIQQSADQKISYIWYRLKFFTQWVRTGCNVILCFDLPLFMRDRVLSCLSPDEHESRIHDPYSVHASLMGEVTSVFNISVWSLRDLTREIELNRIGETPPQPDYPRLHELARHIIHSSETLTTAIDTLLEMDEQHRSFLKERAVTDKAHVALSRKITSSLRFQISIFKSLKGRSVSLEKRLQSETNLAFNLVNQYDSRIAALTGKAAQSDSAAMKTIAVLTLVFLPGTFVSSVLSTSFFNFSPSNQTDPERWQMSKEFWIYWAMVVPLTGGVLICWFAWNRWYAKKILDS